MDSTTVAQVTTLARDLGVTAKQAFVAWLFVKVGIHVIWAAFATFAVHRAAILLGRVGRGQQLLGIITEGIWTRDSEFKKAVTVLAEAFKDKP